MDNQKVSEIVRNVQAGVRKKSELKRCGCEECLSALKILGGK